MAKALASFIVRRRIWIFLFFVALTAVSLVFIPQVKINYDFAEYLPEGMPSKNGVDVQEQEFGVPDSAKVMVDLGAEGRSFGEAMAECLEIKQEIEAVPGVDYVLWADASMNLYQPDEFLDDDLLESYYKDGKALYSVYFPKNNTIAQTDAALEDIAVLRDNLYISGGAMDNKTVRETTEKETTNISIVVVPIVLVILFLATTSWLEPLLFLIIIGVSILLNMGSNIMFNHISFITNSMLFVLQLAISMDYSIFLLHRFSEEREKGLELEPAMVEAISKSISSILSSSLTTVAGFAALILMRFSIGADIGLVFSKGILITLLCVIFLFPAIIMFFAKPIEKLQHRSFIPRLGGLARVGYKLRYAIFALALILVVPSYIAQTKNEYIYGQSSLTAAEGTKSYEAYQRITDTFGRDNPVVVLVPKGDLQREAMLCDALEAMPEVNYVQARVTLAPVQVPDEILPEQLMKQFMSNNYSRIVISLATKEESRLAYDATNKVNALAQEYYPGTYHIVGSTAISADIRDVVRSDSVLINLISIGAVWLILLFTFRSLLVPFVLVASIELAIFINMAVPYFSGISMVYIGYLIISSIQLGATIDYAILMANRYMEGRRTMLPRPAAESALDTAGGSVITSALILFIAGMTLGMISSIDTISQMGTLIGRGAILSCIMVLFLIPQLMILLDRAIEKTTMGAVFYREDKA